VKSYLEVSFIGGNVAIIVIRITLLVGARYVDKAFKLQLNSCSISLIVKYVIGNDEPLERNQYGAPPVKMYYLYTTCILQGGISGSMTGNF
jgi:hypothetical protein